MPLRANVYVVPPTPWELPNTGGRQGGIWSPTSLTLIHGEKEALLVDTPITIPQTEKFIEWLEKTVPGKRLTTIYITHGHSDHWLGYSTWLQQCYTFSNSKSFSQLLQAKMEELYPNRFNPAILKWGCNAALGLPMFAGF
ncbi:hypothetical protein BTUL_0159g00140 [Botrytis tulipae]|uniref:Metallo-beta-lactamase domain-containing protein n=1 Tax=Botrytis tulipae TaxID=87230 RepID=A0A4Z1EL24_9HELO|nr:hypothetical protein BTUL_0159g00140 [Botrytis tulipae]